MTSPGGITEAQQPVAGCQLAKLQGSAALHTVCIYR
jgi:hypothetical protein